MRLAAGEVLKYFERDGQGSSLRWPLKLHARSFSEGTVPVQITMKASAAGESGRLRSVTSTKGRTKASPRTLSGITADCVSIVRAGTTPMPAPAATAPETAA